MKAKINQSKSTTQGGNDSIVQPCAYQNKNTVVKQHNVGHFKSSEQYYDSITDMCNVNHFTILQTLDSNGVDSNECISPVVEDASNSDSDSASDSVRTENSKQGRQKNKKTSAKK